MKGKYAWFDVEMNEVDAGELEWTRDSQPATVRSATNGALETVKK